MDSGAHGLHLPLPEGPGGSRRGEARDALATPGAFSSGRREVPARLCSSHSCFVKASVCRAPSCHFWKDSLTSRPVPWKRAGTHVASRTPCISAGAPLPAAVQLPFLPSSGNQCFSPPRLCLSRFLCQISISFKSYSSFQVDIAHLLPEASLAFLALLGRAQLCLCRTPPLVLVVVTPRCHSCV